jgi:predicted DNA-binding protein
MYARKTAMPVQQTKNLHVPLPDQMYARLRHESSRSKRPATDLAREAIDRWLAERERAHIHEAIAEYAAEFAGTDEDLDEALQEASLEYLADEEKHVQLRSHT